MSTITSPAFRQLVQSLKKHNKTVTVAEQSCGGLIQASIMAQPGASSVFVGGSLPYNTKKGKALLLNDERLHESLVNTKMDKATADGYKESKFDWTSKVASAFCHELQTDYAIAEGGAVGPTFAPNGMKKGFSVLSVAGKDSSGNARLRKQRLIESPNNDREGNMRRFADAAAELLRDVIEEDSKGSGDSTTERSQPEERVPKSHSGSTLTLDRATTLRTDAAALENLKPMAKYVVTKGNDMLFRSPNELAILNYESLTLKYDPKCCTETFLGRFSDDECTPLFSIDVVDEALGEDTSFDLENNTTGEAYFYANVRTNAPLLNTLENEIALHTMAFANWQRSSNFCSGCGSPLDLTQGGTAQICQECKSISWPRQDPSIIVSISSRCGNKLLLARSHRHPPKMHTVLAGFVEAGESLEHAVARETYEEVGLQVDMESIRYLSSQPWPFPRSTMVAFSAQADASQPLTIDENELVDAKWFHKDQVLLASAVKGPVMDPTIAKLALEKDPDLPLLIPPKQVVARRLIDHWLQGS